MAIEGVDYAFPPIPTAAALKAAGKRFACRYGGPGSPSKQLTVDELAALRAAGIAVVANAEGAPDGLQGGYSAGRSWAADAEAHFRALGMPADRPIYLSVDFDAASADWPALDAAMTGAASVLGRGRVGVYGGYNVINHFASMKDRLATWYWQTYAWSTISGSVLWHPAAHIQQYRNGVTIGGADCDLNRAMVADYGQWTGEGDDMEQTDRLVYPTINPNRTVGQVLADTSNLRDWKYAIEGSSGATNPPPEGSRELLLNQRVRQISADVAELKARPPVVAGPVDPAALKEVLLDPEVLTAIAQAVAGELAARLES
jgi:hypothetical protein